MSRVNFKTETKPQPFCAILSNMDNGLETWLTTKLQQRGWSIRELARRGGVSHTAINNALAGSARLDTYKAIARGLGIPLMEVLQQAGEIPLPPEPVQDEQTALRLFRQIKPIYRNLALRVLDAFAQEPNIVTVDDIQRLQTGESIVLRQLDDSFLRLVEALSGDQIDRLIDLITTLRKRITVGDGGRNRRDPVAVDRE